MSTATGNGRGPTIVLIGGRVTVDGGDTFDSRQKFSDDPWSVLPYRTLVGSPAWWQAAVSVATPVLAETTANSYALVLADQRLKELRSDGSLKWRMLRTVLPGEVSTFDLHRVTERAPAPEGHEILGDFSYNMGSPTALWRIGRYEFYLRECGISHFAPAVVIDAEQWPYIHRFAAKENFVHFETARTWDGVVLIVPHTLASQAFFDGYCSWHAGGRRGQRQHLPKQSASKDPERSRMWDAASAVIEADLSITGLVQGGQWHDPSDLEAARTLLLARYDLKLGIWDLASNPTLRQSLLDSVPTPDTPDQPAAVPSTAIARRKTAAAKGEQKTQAREAAKAAIYARLEPHGWCMERAFMYPLVDWHGQLRDGVLLRLTFSVTNHQNSISIVSDDWKNCPTDSYVQERRSLLEQIALPDQCGATDGDTQIWKAPGGWADPVDWEARAARIVTRTERWVDVFADLATRVREVQRRSETAQIAEFKRLGIPEQHWRMY